MITAEMLKNHISHCVIGTLATVDARVFGYKPYSKIHGVNMVSTWGRHDPGGPMLAPWTLLSGKAMTKFQPHMCLTPHDVTLPMWVKMSSRHISSSANFFVGAFLKWRLDTLKLNAFNISQAPFLNRLIIFEHNLRHMIPQCIQIYLPMH